jgi:hypothetical protein
MRTVLTVFLLLVSSSAWARAYDVSLDNLRDNAEDSALYVGAAQEMALVLAPLHLGPARTTGHSGFEYILRVSSHNIDEGAEYWPRVFQLEGATNPPDTLRTTTIEVRKGLPFGVELDTSITWLENSETIALGGRLRIGLLEGYQDRYAPDLSVHASINRMLGSTDLDLTTLATGATMSYRRSLAGRMSMTPYLGYDFMLLQAGAHLLRNPDFDPANRSPEHPRLITFDQLDLSKPENQWNRLRYGLRLETIAGALTVQHDLPLDGGSDHKTQNVITVGISAHF